jgi:transaldolase
MLSTGSETSAHDETQYLTGIIAPGTIHAASEEVIAALVDHAVISASTMIGGYSEAAEVFGDLDAIGIDLGDVFAMLASESLISLERAWLELLDCVRRQLAPGPR